MINKTKFNIYRFLFVGRAITIASILMLAIAAIIFSARFNALYEKQMNTIVFLDNEGDIIPFKWMNRKEAIDIEIKHHLQLFHQYFYQYGSNNVTENTDKALWLGDNSVQQLYIKRKNDGWYNRVRMYNVSQTIKLDSIKLFGYDEPYSFTTYCTLIIQQDKMVEAHLFQTQGQIIFTDRNYPLNPHGLLIVDFLETNSTKIK